MCLCNRAKSGTFWWRSQQIRKFSMKKVNRERIIDIRSGTRFGNSVDTVLPVQNKNFSQETQRSLQKFLEPERKPKVIYTDNSLEFSKACEDLSWNHCTSTPHRSETYEIAERAVRRVKEGTSAVLLQSGLDKEWWADSMECYCFLGNIQDLLSDGKIRRTSDTIWSNSRISPYFSECQRITSIWPRNLAKYILDVRPALWRQSVLALPWRIRNLCPGAFSTVLRHHANWRLRSFSMNQSSHVHDQKSAQDRYGENEVSDASTRFTRFVLLTEKQLDGSWSGKRCSRYQTMVGPDMWKFLSEATHESKRKMDYRETIARQCQTIERNILYWTKRRRNQTHDEGRSQKVGSSNASSNALQNTDKEQWKNPPQ